MTKVRIGQSFEARGAHSSVSCTAEGIEVELDEMTLAQRPARALLEAIVTGIRAISEAAAPATLKRRARAGITGSRLFNASGRLAELLGLRADTASKSYDITAPPDRLDLHTFGGELGKVIERLRELVPALRAPLDVPAFKNALEQTVTAMFRKVR